MPLKDKRIAIFVEMKYEDLELWYPALRLEEEGAEILYVGAKPGEMYESKHGYPAKTTHAIADVSVGNIDAIVVPGGFSPDYMRREPKFKKLIQEAVAAGKPVAAICHGPWMLCSAKVLEGRQATSFFSIRDDMENAGANWVDQEVVVDGPLITSRSPKDLIPFTKAIIQALS